MVSRSEQNFSSVLRKAEEEMDKKNKIKSAAIRRHSVTSKHGSIKPDKINPVPGGTGSIDSQPKIKPVSLQGKACEPCKSALKVGNGKSASKGTTVSFWGTTSSKTPAKKQCAVEQASGLLKPGDVPRKSHSGVNGGARSTVVAVNAESRHGGVRDASLLKSALYWLEQVQLAESIEKHGVAIGFFRFAVECEAEPIQLLREEMLSYKKRYSLCSDDISQAMLCYGVADESQESLIPQAPGDIFADSESGSGFRELSSSSTTENNAVRNDTSNQAVQQSANTSGVLENVASSKNDLEDKTVNKEKDDFQRHRVSEGTSDVYDTLSQESKPACAGPIEAMDVDTLTREVVSYIMSSMDDSIESQAFRQDAAFGSEDNNVTLSPFKENRPVVKLLEEFQVCSDEEKLNNLMTNNSRDTSACEMGYLDHAESTGSMPSLDVWNNSSIEIDIGTIEIHENQSIDGKCEVEATDSLKFNAEQESVQRKENVNSSESVVQANDLTERVSKGLAQQTEFSTGAFDLTLEGTGTPIRIEDRQQGERISNRKLAADGKRRTASLESPKTGPNCTGSAKKGRPAKRTEPIAGNQNQTANGSQASCQLKGALRKPLELDSAKINRVTSKTVVQNVGKDEEPGQPPELVTPKERRLSARASVKAPASNPESNMSTYSKTRSRAGAQLSHASRDVGTAVARQQVNLPQNSSPSGTNSALVTPIPTSASRSRRGNNQVSVENGSLPVTESADALATPVAASTGSTDAIRRSARLRPTTSGSTPCQVSTPRSVSSRRERAGQR